MVFADLFTSIGMGLTIVSGLRLAQLLLSIWSPNARLR